MRSEGGGARSTGQGFSVRLQDPTYRSWGWGPLRVPQHVRVWGDPGHALPLPPPLSTQTKEPRRAARCRRRCAQSESRRDARPAPELTGPAGCWLDSARLPGVTGVPVEVVTEARAPLQRGAEERGPKDSPQQGQQPHCPRGPVWSGSARPTSRWPRERYKVEKRG